MRDNRPCPSYPRSKCCASPWNAGCLAAAFTSGRKIGRLATSLHGVDEHAHRVMDMLALPIAAAILRRMGRAPRGALPS